MLVVRIKRGGQQTSGTARIRQRRPTTRNYGLNTRSFASQVSVRTQLNNHQCTGADRTESARLAFRVLRHRTKNALQRIMAQCEGAELRRTTAGAALADDIQRRILLSARISDALFELTAEPAPPEHWLGALVGATVDLLCDDVQTIQAETETHGRCPEPLVPIGLQVAHEMVGNAVLHGMHMRLLGKVFVSLRVSGDSAVDLRVHDDGWGPGTAKTGEGRSIVARLAEQHGGSASLGRMAGWTLARMYIPPVE